MGTKIPTIGLYGIQDINNSNTPTISHDHGIAVMKNGKITLSSHLERLNRNKHSADMAGALYRLLKEKKLFSEKCNYVFVDNILGNSFINTEGNIRFEGPLNNKLNTHPEKGRFWLLDKPGDGYLINHELAHLGSCLPFYGNFIENSLLVHFDGGASLSNFSAWLYQNKELKPIEYNWDMKWLSSLYNANALVFAMVNARQIHLNSVPGKFMGFASFGTYSEEIEHWLRENNFFSSIWKTKRDFFNKVFDQFKISINNIDQQNSFIQNTAATIQYIFVRETLNKIKQLQKQFKPHYLYYSGGSALNILLNSKITEANLFKDVFIPPCCNDSGLALGAAAFFEWHRGNNIEVNNAYVNNWGIEDYTTNYNKQTIKEVAELLLNKKVIGICNGIAETGPRALGNRSIIGLASDKNLADKISMIHKQREWYRPVAPIMLEKNAKYFTKNNSIHHLSKYMLLDFKISNDKKDELEGAVHCDGTSRIQTIYSREENPFVYDLLNFLNDQYNIKALINTSFNIKGEPIVHTTDDAIKSATNMNLDAVVLNGKLKTIKN